MSALKCANAGQMELVAANKMKENLLAAVSHELRTPLNGINGLTEALMGDKRLDQQVQGVLKIISDSGRQLNQLVSDMLDTASLCNNSFQLRFEPCSIYNIIDDALSSVFSLFSAGIQVRKP